MRRLNACKHAALTAVLAVLGIAVLAGTTRPVLADPVVGGGPTSTTTITTVPSPTVTPDGDVIVRPVESPYVAPQPIVKAKSFTPSLWKKRETRRLQRGIEQYRCSGAKWAFIRGVHFSCKRSRSLATAGIPALKRQLRVTKAWHDHQQGLTQNVPNLSHWQCIHHYEGAWNDTGGPYWGGLQMSLSFQQRYGRLLFRTLGTADHWTPLEQIWTAEKASKTRGYWPWPNTARMCGLLR